MSTTTVNIFFKAKESSTVVQLPVVPEKVKISQDGNLESVDIVNLGSVAIPRTPSLTELSFSSFFPQTNIGSYVMTKNKFWKPTKYIEYFENVMKEKTPMLVTITGFPAFSMSMLIDKFDYEWVGGENDCEYDLDLIKYEEITISSVPLIERYTKPEAVEATTDTTTSATAAVEKQVTVGCEVTLNGTVHKDSYGSSPGKTFSNYHGKINFVKTDGRSHPYHVTTLSGGWLGWVVPSAVTVL